MLISYFLEINGKLNELPKHTSALVKLPRCQFFTTINFIDGANNKGREHNASIFKSEVFNSFTLRALLNNHLNWYYD